MIRSAATPVKYPNTQIANVVIWSMMSLLLVARVCLPNRSPNENTGGEESANDAKGDGSDAKQKENLDRSIRHFHSDVSSPVLVSGHKYDGKDDGPKWN
jgi:hypothetical protein